MNSLELWPGTELPSLVGRPDHCETDGEQGLDCLSESVRRTIVISGPRRTPRDNRELPPLSPWSGVRGPLGLLLLAVVAIVVAVVLWSLPGQKKPPSVGQNDQPDDRDRPAAAVAAGWGPAYGADASAEQLRDEARRVAEQVAAKYPDSPAALGVLARVHQTLGETREAVALWERAVAREPAFADGHFAIATVCLRRGDFSQAVERLEWVAALTPGDPRVSAALAAAWLGLGQVEKVVTVLEKPAAAGPLAPEAAVLLGQAYLQQENYAAAQRLFTQLIQRTPQEAKAYYGLARCCLHLGRREEAQRYLRRFQELEQQRVEEERRHAHAFMGPVTARGLLVQTLLAAAAVYFAGDDAAQAEEQWQRVAHLEPQHIASRQQLLGLYQSQDRNRAALAVGVQLCQLEPEQAEHWFNVAVLRSCLNEYDAALTAVDRALALEPQNSRYRQAQDLIRKGKGN